MEEYTADLVVAGGGFSGVCAAIAAARLGLKTILVQDRPVFGGNSSSEIGVGINGAAALGHSPSVYAREGGICEEIRLAMAYHAGAGIHTCRDIAYFEAIYAEKNLTSFLNTYVDNVEMKEGRIEAFTAVQLGSGRKFRLKAPIFADATGDGSAAYLAGAEFMYGREARSDFDESLAPEQADDYTLGSTIMFDSRHENQKVGYTRPDFAYDVTQLSFFENLGKSGLERNFYRGSDGDYHSFWWLEYGGQEDTVKDSENIALELRKLIYGFWDYIKNSGEFADTENLSLFHVAPVAGKRESRRFKGDYIYSQKDVDEKRQFDDAVSTAGWEMDVHAPKGVYDSGPATIWHYVAGVLELPFGMMYSVNVPNLMFAGRDASSTHIALGTTRLAATGAAMGQAVGTAAYLCRKYNATPREVRKNHMEEFRKLLYDNDQYLVGFRGRGTPELYEDLTVETESCKEFSNSLTEGMISLEKGLGLALPITDRLDSFEIGVKNSGAATVLEYHIYGGERKENYIPSALLKTERIPIEENTDGWITLPIGCKTSADDKLYIVFEKNEQLSLYANKKRLTGAVSFRPEKLILYTKPVYAGAMRIMRTELDEAQAETEICFKNVLPPQALYSADNLTDGFNRPYGLPHLWISDTAKMQTITLRYAKPKRVRQIVLTFNTELEHDGFSELPKSLIKTYDIKVFDSDGEATVYSVHDNYQRVNRIEVNQDGVTQIELVLKENYGSDYYEIYDLKLI